MEIFNKSKRGDLIYNSARLLKEKYHCIIMKYLQDKIGNYAVQMKTGNNFPFMLVGKASKVRGDNIISVQKKLLESWKCILVLAFQPLNYNDVSFFVFDPEKCLMFTKFENVRGSLMNNFNFNIGLSWDPAAQDLSVMWKKMRSSQKKLF